MCPPKTQCAVNKLESLIKVHNIGMMPIASCQTIMHVIRLLNNLLAWSLGAMKFWKHYTKYIFSIDHNQVTNYAPLSCMHNKVSYNPVSHSVQPYICINIKMTGMDKCHLLIIQQSLKLLKMAKDHNYNFFYNSGLIIVLNQLVTLPYKTFFKNNTPSAGINVVIHLVASPHHRVQIISLDSSQC